MVNQEYRRVIASADLSIHRVEVCGCVFVAALDHAIAVSGHRVVDYQGRHLAQCIDLVGEFGHNAGRVEIQRALDGEKRQAVERVGPLLFGIVVCAPGAQPLPKPSAFCVKEHHHFALHRNAQSPVQCEKTLVCALSPDHEDQRPAFYVRLEKPSSVFRTRRDLQGRAQSNLRSGRRRSCKAESDRAAVIRDHHMPPNRMRARICSSGSSQ